MAKSLHYKVMRFYADVDQSLDSRRHSAGSLQFAGCIDNASRYNNRAVGST